MENDVAHPLASKKEATGQRIEEHPFSKTSREVEKKLSEKSSAAANLQAGGSGSVNLSRQVNLVKFLQDPYTSTDYARFEQTLRKSSPVKIGFKVRRHFMFSKGSELQIRLNDYEIQILDKEEQEAKIQQIKDANVDLLEELEQRDIRLKITKVVKTLVLQAWAYGRGVLIKLYNDDSFSESKIAKLQTINSRRLLFPVIDIDNNNSFEGCIIDVQGLDKKSMIYATYDEDELSPYTEQYGYSEIETIAHIAEIIWVLTNEDLKEISKSAWLDSILAEINTAGLDNATAQTKINTIVGSIAKAGKIVGVNEEVKLQAVSKNPNFSGIVEVINKLELMIFNALQVPEFLVQSEAAANRATAITSATQFLNGVVADDQQWIEDILQDQWYDPFLRENLFRLQGIDIATDDNTDSSNDTTTEIEPDLPFHIRRVFNQAKASEFADLAGAIAQLKSNGIWDVQKCNEVLDSEEVTPRVLAKEEDMRNQQQQMMQQTNQRKDAMGNIIPNTPPKTEQTTQQNDTNINESEPNMM